MRSQQGERISLKRFGGYRKETSDACRGPDCHFCCIRRTSHTRLKLQKQHYLPMDYLWLFRSLRINGGFFISHSGVFFATANPLIFFTRIYVVVYRRHLTLGIKNHWGLVIFSSCRRSLRHSGFLPAFFRYLDHLNMIIFFLSVIVFWSNIIRAGRLFRACGLGFICTRLLESLPDAE